jgi:hypothetical protein
MPGFIAVELCKKQGVDLKFVPTHFDRYKAASDEVREGPLALSLCTTAHPLHTIFAT